MFNPVYFLWYKTKQILLIVIPILFLIGLYCNIFKISYIRFFVYYILPIFQLFVNLYYILLKLLNLPWLIVLSIWQAFLKILGMFGFVISFITNIALFTSNITNEVYIVS